jgi:hypothetical protein
MFPYRNLDDFFFFAKTYDPSFLHPTSYNALINIKSKIFCHILETAMGQHVNAQGDKDSEYVKAVYE